MQWLYLESIKVITVLCLISKTNAYNCWCCSSDESKSEFCGKFLDETKLTNSQKLVNLVPCAYPDFDSLQGRDVITKCLIKKTLHSGNVVYSRSCIWEERNASADSCLSQPTWHGYQMLACETCTEDKCNYKLNSESHGNSTYLSALYKIVFICLVICII